MTLMHAVFETIAERQAIIPNTFVHFLINKKVHSTSRDKLTIHILGSKCCGLSRER